MVPTLTLVFGICPQSQAWRGAVEIFPKNLVVNRDIKIKIIFFLFPSDTTRDHLFASRGNVPDNTNSLALNAKLFLSPWG